MVKRYQKKIIWAAIGVIFIILIVYRINENKKPGAYDDFAKCLKEKGAIFYGAFWCSHCQNQKAIFGKSAKYLPYVECSTSDGRGEMPICKEKKIDSFPTWVFADETRDSKEFSLEELAKKTTCLLPTNN